MKGMQGINPKPDFKLFIPFIPFIPVTAFPVFDSRRI
jgi:hypothetical protein